MALCSPGFDQFTLVVLNSRAADSVSVSELFADRTSSG
jgi:hypothetical protein